jgi:hypothetical protein
VDVKAFRFQRVWTSGGEREEKMRDEKRGKQREKKRTEEMAGGMRRGINEGGGGERRGGWRGGFHSTTPSTGGLRSTTSWSNKVISEWIGGTPGKNQRKSHFTTIMIGVGVV